MPRGHALPPELRLARRRETKRLWQRKYLARNHATIKAKKKADYHANKAKHLAKHKAYYVIKQDVIKAQSAARYAALRARMATDDAFHAAWRLDHSLKLQAWREANPDLAVLQTGRRRARKRKLPATFTAAEQAFCRQYFHYACAVCGREEGFEFALAMDHWIPLSSSECPGTIATNMIPLCHGMHGCNNSKHTKDPEAWLIARFGPRKARQILARIRAYFAIVAARQAQSS